MNFTFHSVVAAIKAAVIAWVVAFLGTCLIACLYHYLVADIWLMPRGLTPGTDIVSLGSVLADISASALYVSIAWHCFINEKEQINMRDFVLLIGLVMFITGAFFVGVVGAKMGTTMLLVEIYYVSLFFMVIVLIRSRIRRLIKHYEIIQS
jgi:hypothetical protein